MSETPEGISKESSREKIFELKPKIKNPAFALQILDELKKEIEEGKIKSLAVFFLRHNKEYVCSTDGDYLEIIGLISASMHHLMAKKERGEI